MRYLIKEFTFYLFASGFNYKLPGADVSRLYSATAEAEANGGIG